MTVHEFCKRYNVPVGQMLWPILKANFPIEVKLPDTLAGRDHDTYDKASAWSTDTFTDIQYVQSAYRFFFKNETDAMQFKLAWVV
jgi:hypothetical protein